MIYYTGDIHGDVTRVLNSISAVGISADDAIVILGDVGLNYFGDDNIEIDRDRKKKLNNAKIEILCIHGNHEMRPEKIPSYSLREWKGGIVYYEPEFPYLLFARDGEIYDLDGQKSLVIGGAYSVDKYYRLEHGYKWFSDEQPSEDTKHHIERILEWEGWKVDQVLSHTCPKKYIPLEAFISGVDQSTVDNSTEEFLDSIEDRLQYSEWFCGHWHIDKTIDKMHFVMYDYLIST